MFRLYYNIFWGKERAHEHDPARGPDDRWLLPLVIPRGRNTCRGGLHPFRQIRQQQRRWTTSSTSTGRSPAPASLIAVVAIGLWPRAFYRKDRAPIPRPSGHARSAGCIAPLSRSLLHRRVVPLRHRERIIFNCVSRPIAWFDRHVIDGSLNGLANVTQRLSYSIRGLRIRTNTAMRLRDPVRLAINTGLGFINNVKMEEFTKFIKFIRSIRSRVSFGQCLSAAPAAVDKAPRRGPRTL